MTAALPLVDATIFIRHVRQDHADHSPRATAYLLQIRRGERTVRSTALVLSEVVYVLQSFYRMSKADIVQALLPLIGLPDLKIAHKARLRKTLDWYVRYNVSFIDASLAVLAQGQQLPAVVSLDRNDDRMPGITRVEP
jgi:predicted nucleic acid-binding protein